MIKMKLNYLQIYFKQKDNQGSGVGGGNNDSNETQHIEKTFEIVANVSGVKPALDEGLRQISAPVSTGSKALFDVLKALDESGIHALDVGLKRPSLDDVFLSLTGHSAENNEAK